MTEINAQDVHQLAMGEVGKFLEENDYEFLAVNSQPKKNPQFVCKREKQLYFIVVKGCLYPENPKSFDGDRIAKLKEHAKTHKATLLFAGVGFAHAADYERTLTKKDTYVVNFDGLQTVD